MPIGCLLPYLIVEGNHLNFGFFVGLLKDQFIFNLADIYKLNAAFCLHQGCVHIAKGNVHEEGIYLLLVVHYFLRLSHVFVQANVHLLDYVVGKVLVCTKTLDHPNPVGVAFSKYV